MAKLVEDLNKKRLRSSNITVSISIALVLFLVGLFWVDIDKCSKIFGLYQRAIGGRSLF